MTSPEALLLRHVDDAIAVAEADIRGGRTAPEIIRLAAALNGLMAARAALRGGE